MLAMACAPFCQALAQETAVASDDPVVLDPFEVLAHPVVEMVSLTNLADKQTIVGRDQIEQIGAGDLTAALQRVPGVTVSRYNVVGAFGGGDGGAVFIRGHGSGRPGGEIATLVDGAPRFVGVWTHPLVDTLPIDFASQIQVHKSPQPVRFGSMSFGAINILPAQAVKQGLSSALRAEYGTWDTVAVMGEVTYLDGPVNVHAGYSHRESDGHRENADGEVDAFQTRIAYKLGNGWEASFLTQVIDSQANDPEPEGLGLPIVENYDIEDNFYLAKLAHHSDEWDVEFRGYYEEGNLDWRQWHQPPPAPFPAQQLNSVTTFDNYGLRSRAERRFEALSLSGGLDWDIYGGAVTEDFAEGSDMVFDELKFKMLSPHATAELELGSLAGFDSASVSVGARYFDHDVFDGKLGGQGGVELQKGGVVVYANAARSYNYPGVYVSVFGRRPPPWSIGDDWRELNPEAVDHYELGVVVELPRGHASFSIFRDEVSNALRIAPPPPAGFILNLGDYEINGAEANLHYSPFEVLMLYGGLTILDTDETVPNAPDWSASAGFTWKPIERWSVNGDWQYVGDRRVISTRFGEILGEVGAYNLVGLRISHELDLGEAVRANIYVRVENMLDEDYEHRAGYPMPGAQLIVGTHLRF